MPCEAHFLVHRTACSWQAKTVVVNQFQPTSLLLKVPGKRGSPCRATRRRVRHQSGNSANPIMSRLYDINTANKLNGMSTRPWPPHILTLA
jgi:hypothetical protein